MTSSCSGHPVGLILGLADSLRVHLDESARAVGLTAQQAELLARIEAPTRMNELADQRVCDPSSITSLVQRLERDGFVTRMVDPTDGRARIIRLTAKGRRARQRFVDMAGDGTDVVRALSDTQRAALAALFSQSPAPAAP